MFNVFRREDSAYFCYQEPLNELVLNAKNNPNELLLTTGQGELQSMLRHPKLEKPYFAELHETNASWKTYFSPEIIFDDYFGTLAPMKTNQYLKSLIEASKGKFTVIQTCRTASRIHTIKAELGGHHIGLWRNPWDQWWSHKASEYFEIALQLIANSQSTPAAMDLLKRNINFVGLENQPLPVLTQHFQERGLLPKHSYKLFFLLWCLARLEARDHADTTVSIDRLSNDESYQAEFVNQMDKLGFTGFDVSDCSATQASFSPSDAEFFAPLQHKVIGLLIDSGLSKTKADWLQSSLKQCTEDKFRTIDSETEKLSVVDDLRKVVLSVQTNRTQFGTQTNNLIGQLNTKIVEYKAKLTEAKNEKEKLSSIASELEKSVGIFAQVSQDQSENLNALATNSQNNKKSFLDQIEILRHEYNKEILQTRSQLQASDELLEKKSEEIDSLLQKNRGLESERDLVSRESALTESALQRQLQDVINIRKSIENDLNIVKAELIEANEKAKHQAIELQEKELDSHRLKVELKGHQKNALTHKKMHDTLLKEMSANRLEQKKNHDGFTKDLKKSHQHQLKLRNQLSERVKDLSLRQVEIQTLTQKITSQDATLESQDIALQELYDELNKTKNILTENKQLQTDLLLQSEMVEQKNHELEILRLGFEHKKLTERSLQSRVTDLESSTSWKITRPLRGLKNLVNGSSLKRFSLGFVRQFPWVKPPILLVLSLLPGVKRRALNYAANNRPTDVVPIVTSLHAPKQTWNKWVLTPPPSALNHWRSLLKVPTK